MCPRRPLFRCVILAIALILSACSDPAARTDRSPEPPRSEPSSSVPLNGDLVGQLALPGGFGVAVEPVDQSSGAVALNGLGGEVTSLDVSPGRRWIIARGELAQPPREAVWLFNVVSGDRYRLSLNPECVGFGPDDQPLFAFTLISGLEVWKVSGVDPERVILDKFEGADGELCPRYFDETEGRQVWVPDRASGDIISTGRDGQADRRSVTPLPSCNLGITDFVEKTGASLLTVSCVDEAKSGLYEMDRSGATRQVLTTAGFASWNPEGTLFVYSQGPTFGRSIVDREGRVIQQGAGYRSPVWLVNADALANGTNFQPQVSWNAS